jgi:hypothetical protein
MLLPHDVAVHEHASPHVGSQSVSASGSHEPSLAQVPAHECFAQSGQHNDPVCPSRFQQREPIGHSACEPAAEHAVEASVMQTP